MHTIKINGKPYQIPTKLSEVTLGQFFKLRKAKNLIDEVCALTGMDRLEGMNFATPDEIKKSYAFMAPIAKEIQAGKIEGHKLPDKIFLGGKVINIPKKIALEPVGAFINAHDIIAELHNQLISEGKEINYTDVIPQVLAHYFYVPYHTAVNNGKSVLYDDEKAESPEFMKLIEQIPFVQAVPIANFFFRKFPSL